MADLPDLIPSFMSWLRGGPVLPIQPSTFLFPSALFFPGWQHMWDNLLKVAAYQLIFFPGFLETVKCIVKVCTLPIYRDVVQACLVARKHYELAKHLGEFQVGEPIFVGTTRCISPAPPPKM